MGECRGAIIWQQMNTSTCDVMLFEGVAVDLVLTGTVLLQPFAHVLLGP